VFGRAPQLLENEPKVQAKPKVLAVIAIDTDIASVLAAIAASTNEQSSGVENWYRVIACLCANVPT